MVQWLKRLLGSKEPEFERIKMYPEITFTKIECQPIDIENFECEPLDSKFLRDS
ncbi:MAG: hypothetical protein ACPGUD_11850 [Parashewanella sp.]